jgi:hypothetical protein
MYFLRLNKRFFASFAGFETLKKRHHTRLTAAQACVCFKLLN